MIRGIRSGIKRDLVNTIRLCLFRPLLCRGELCHLTLQTYHRTLVLTNKLQHSRVRDNMTLHLEIANIGNGLILVSQMRYRWILRAKRCQITHVVYPFLVLVFL